MIWVLFNGKIPHLNLPHYGERASIVLFTHSAVYSKVAGDAVALAAKAGFCVPTLPYKFAPQLEDLKFINQGVSTAVKAYQYLCTSTL